MHGLSTSKTAAFVTISPMGLKDTSSVVQNGRRLRSQPAAMMHGFEEEAFGFAKDVITAAATGATGDLIAQFTEKQRKGDSSLQFTVDDTDAAMESFDFDFDLRRTASYATFAAGYTGAFQHVLFDNLHERIDDPIMRLAVNQGLVIPLVYYSLLVWLVPKLRARSQEEEAQLRGNINVMAMIPRNWAFWVPLQFIQFNYIPADFQVVYCSFLGLIWNVCLSFFTAGGQAKDIPQPTAAELNIEPLADVSISAEPELFKAYETVDSTTPSSTYGYGSSRPSNSTSFSSSTVLAAIEDGMRRR